MEHWLQSSLRGSSEEAPPLLEAEAKHPLGDMLAVSSLYMSDNWVADRIWLDGPVDTFEPDAVRPPNKHELHHPSV